MNVRACIFHVCFLALASTALAQPSTASQGSGPRGSGPTTGGPRGSGPQTAGPTTTPAPAAAPRESAPRREGQPINVKVDVTITDQRGGSTAMRKTVSIVTADAMSGRIRSQADYSGIGVVPLNIDTEQHVLPDGKIRLLVNLQYDLPASPGNRPEETTAANTGSLRRTMIQENLVLILENGKPLVAAQSADPVSDRQVTIEVKATVLK